MAAAGRPSRCQDVRKSSWGGTGAGTEASRGYILQQRGERRLGPVRREAQTWRKVVSGCSGRIRGCFSRLRVLMSEDAALWAQAGRRGTLGKIKEA